MCGESVAFLFISKDSKKYQAYFVDKNNGQMGGLNYLNENVTPICLILDFYEFIYHLQVIM